MCEAVGRFGLLHWTKVEDSPSKGFTHEIIFINHNPRSYDGDTIKQGFLRIL